MALVPWTYNNPHNREASRSDVRIFSFCGKTLKVYQDFTEEISVGQNTHRKLWDGAFLLAKYLETRYPTDSPLWKGDSVSAVELGAGCGLVGMVASLLGAAQVTLTDGRDGLDHTDKCLGANRDALSTSTKKRSSVKRTGNDPSSISCSVLDWRDDESTWDRTFGSSRHSFGVVLGSDVVYSPDEAVLAGFVAALDYLSNPDSLILLSYKPRGLGEDKFFGMAKRKGFEPRFLDKTLHPKEFSGSDYDIVSLKKR